MGYKFKATVLAKDNEYYVCCPDGGTPTGKEVVFDMDSIQLETLEEVILGFPCKTSAISVDSYPLTHPPESGGNMVLKFVVKSCDCPATATPETYYVSATKEDFLTHINKCCDGECPVVPPMTIQCPCEVVEGALKTYSPMRCTLDFGAVSFPFTIKNVNYSCPKNAPTNCLPNYNIGCPKKTSGEIAGTIPLNTFFTGYGNVVSQITSSVVVIETSDCMIESVEVSGHNCASATIVPTCTGSEFVQDFVQLSAGQTQTVSPLANDTVVCNGNITISVDDSALPAGVTMSVANNVVTFTADAGVVSTTVELVYQVLCNNVIIGSNLITLTVAGSGTEGFKLPETVLAAASGDRIASIQDTNGKINNATCGVWGYLRIAVEINGQVSDPIDYTSSMLDLCAINLSGFTLADGNYQMTITRTVYDCAGTGTNTLVVPVTVASGAITSINGYVCSTNPTPLPPITVLAPPVNGILSAPTNNAMSCIGGFTSQSVVINGTNASPLAIVAFPANLCQLLSGVTVPLGTTTLEIVSNVATACGTGSDTITIAITENTGVVDSIEGFSCSSPQPPTTVINAPVNGILPAPTDDDYGCAGGFTMQEVTITSGILNLTITTFPADLVALLCGQPHDGSNTLIKSTVTTACGTATATLPLNLLVQGGVVTGVDGVACQFPPTTTINAPIGTVLQAPTNNDGGCIGGFTDVKFSIGWDGQPFPIQITSFPQDLCSLLAGQTVSIGTVEATLTSSVTTDCGNDVDQLSIPITESGGFITGVNGVTCAADQPPTTDIVSLTGTVIDIVDTNGVSGGSTCNTWISQTIDITTANGTYGPFNVVNGDDLCIILSGYNTGNILDHNNIPVVITRNVEDCGGVASDTLNTYIEFNNGIIEGINGIACEAVLLYDCFEINVSNNFFDRWRVNGGSDIAFPSGNSNMGSVMNEMISTLPQTDVVGISVNPFSGKNFLLSSNSGAITLIEIYNTVLNTWEQFPVASFGQSNPCTI